MKLATRNFSAISCYSLLEPKYTIRNPEMPQQQQNVKQGDY